MKVSDWQKWSSLGRGGRELERWSYRDKGGHRIEFPVRVTEGKALDVQGLKGGGIEDVVEYSGYLRKLSEVVYGSGAALREVLKCPCCEEESKEGECSFPVNGAVYWRCGECGHVYVRNQPSVEALSQVFVEEETMSQVYVDETTVSIRMEQVVRPKLDWVLKNWTIDRGEGIPEKVLDIGAGGGHFVKACLDQGLSAEGVEISEASRAFAREAFSIELASENFLEVERSGIDLVTMWGLLEYVPDPVPFLEKARKIIGADGLLVVEVPRDPSVSALAQKCHPRGMARHLDPCSHVNCFSEASLATALVRAGFTPTAVWRFGMDAYELLVQIALASGKNDLLEEIGDWIPLMQATFDEGGLSDDLIICAIPSQV